MMKLAEDPTPWYPAPAKINRFLHVLGRDPSGYHQLQTVFQFLDWGDSLQILPRADGQILLQGDLSDLPAEQNLAHRAASLLQQESAVGLGADILLHKQIPPGSGLGGGSSDAATVLHVLNRLWGLDWPTERLAALGLRLGADVPVFLHGRACFAEGRGEKLRDVPVPEGGVCLFLPPVHSSTATVFASEQMRRDAPPIDYADWAAAVELGRNDCEAAALACAPELGPIASALRAQADFRLSGTGSAFYCCVPSRKKAGIIGGLVAAVAGHAIVTTLSNLSPLHMMAIPSVGMRP